MSKRSNKWSPWTGCIIGRNSRKSVLITMKKKKKKYLTFRWPWNKIGRNVSRWMYWFHLAWFSLFILPSYCPTCRLCSFCFSLLRRDSRCPDEGQNFYWSASQMKQECQQSTDWNGLCLWPSILTLNCKMRSFERTKVDAEMKYICCLIVNVSSKWGSKNHWKKKPSFWRND